MKERKVRSRIGPSVVTPPRGLGRSKMTTGLRAALAAFLTSATVEADADRPGPPGAVQSMPRRKEGSDGYPRGLRQGLDRGPSLAGYPGRMGHQSDAPPL